jgi:serine/threonine-protein kinase
MPEAPKYRVLRKLEAGGMAEVFQAEVESIEGFKKQVAIKRVLPHLSQNKQFIEMFLDEARLSLKFSHANVAQTFSIGMSDNTYFITMEFIDGVNVRKMMEYYDRVGEAVDPAIASFVINEVCKGLSYAHNLTGPDGGPLGVVHRDVSPPNILISKQGEVKVLDFGLAKATSQLESTDPGLIKGKFAYLSAEAAHGLDVDKRADIFSAGTVLWEMVTGKRLFKGETDFDTVMNVRDAPVPPASSINPDVPVELDAILEKALQKDPDKRYQDAAEMGNDIMKMLFSKQMAVTSYDVAKIVQSIVAAEPKEVSREVDIIDRLIENELERITALEDGENPFADGAKPILTSELSGILGDSDAGSLEDPRQWGADILSDTGEFDLPVNKEAAWRESKVYDLETPTAGDEGAAGGQRSERRPSAAEIAADQTAADFERKDGGGSRVALWIVLGLLAALGGAAAVVWFFVLNK